MPLVRVQVRNEYGLGQPELYREADIREDPKAVLDGVAVAGLVGILRQLGDLAEFAAEVFHGLQEQVMSTSSRSHKLMVRLQRIESAVPPLEKAILAQKSHLHFAYMAGSVWHMHLQNDQNHFIHGDLPQFIMDSYEECRDPPRLHLLDKFDTGGPGSCLKKYSDPTFFRRASANSGVANVSRVSKDRKARRNKKNRAWQRNGVSHGASVSNQSDRMQFASLNVDGQASPSQTISAFDATQPTLKSDLTDQSNSFDLRTGSGYIECVFHPTYSMKPEEHELNESSLSSLRMNHNDTIDSASVDEHSGVMDDDFQRSLSQEQTGPSSSCVSWDEKTEIVEIVEAIGCQCDRDETAEMLTMNFDLDAQDKGAVNFRSGDQMDFTFRNEDTPTSLSGRNQLDDIESETDNYVDALNTIESESETDLDYQTKREVEQSSTFIEETQDGTDDIIANHSDVQPPNLESSSTASSSSTIVLTNDKQNSTSSQCHAKEESLQMAGKSSDSANSVGMDHDDILDISNVESIVSNLPYAGFAEANPNVQRSDKITSASCESQRAPTEPSGVQSVMFWTNGSLLGLEPSKPPDFSVSNAVIKDSVTRSTDNIDSPSCQSNVLNGDGDSQKPDVIDMSTEANQRGSKNESQMFGISNGFLLNSFQRRVSLVHDEKSESPTSRISGAFEQKSRNRSVANQTFPERNFKGYFGNGSPMNSPSSSPPLQHMKISFQPISESETSKLKLKFPDGSYRHDCSRDTLPAFQLVPEPATPRHDNGSVSDDDTFCRSSPYMSDDCLSHHSDSNSEQWESDDTPPSSNNELYDVLRRISLTESASSSVELDRIEHGSFHADYGLKSPYVEACMEPCRSGRSLDLPSLSTLNPLFDQDMKIGSDAKEIPKLHLPDEPTPLPPPLPPVQWLVNSDVTTGKEDSVSENINHAFEMKTLGSAISQQSNPSQPKQRQSTDETIEFTPKIKQPERQKENQATNGRGIEEKDDFLHQIRTKSFNLRRTATEKPTNTPGPAANVSVTAILEKANAIRQAVGSDDDNWSDT